ncbi:uncharacterized protein DUF222 [Pseudonocardia sediminis]|uniref:Uncharacterized protein DUF222 n=1 Tax=Pseudonocardia sediminis TaxID=1397368 RepID=A0A4Q7USR5_PSEST|nr:HNH endonuclease signature motif containing protein [Pseudonocardia sediminis]RZT83811.1 uncharacterized protein DUF222 [Pseudonocardia sediminis]
MTAVADFSVPGTRPEPVAPTFELVDLTLLRLLDESDPDPLLGSRPEVELVDRIAQLESLQHRVAALQSAAIHAFARRHVASRVDAGVVDPERLERSVAGQIALACRVSPIEGGKRMRMARDLRNGHDHVLALFTAGEISAYKTATITAATSGLDADERAEVDRRIAAHDIVHMGVGRIRTLAQAIAAEVAPEKFTARSRAARQERRVSLRPAPDGMTDLIAHLPLEQGVACYAALAKAVNEAAVSPEPVTRGRGQIMADTLVERVTGQATAPDVAVEVQVVVPVEALIDPDSPLPAHIPGHGPVPLDVLATSSGRKTLRRLLTRAGIVIGGDSRQRLFTGVLAEWIRARDGYRCSEPYCDAPIRHIDHIHRSADDGQTEFDNGRGVCEFHNHLRETSGWKVEKSPDGVRTTTPTGHTYTAPAWRVPGYGDT